MSLGYGLPSLPVREALQDALNRGVVVVASSGNSGNTATAHGSGHAPYSFPADYPGVLGVAAVSRSGSPAAFSSDNLSVQVAAPGVNVPAQGRDGQYWLVSGTSPACALTAGVAALIKAKYPGLAPAQVVQAITSSTQNRPASGYDDKIGFGTVDAAAALAAAAKTAGQQQRGQVGAATTLHFGGGAAAVPPVPIAPRGAAGLAVAGLFLLAFLIATGLAGRRLMAVRRTLSRGQHAAYRPPQPVWPGPQVHATWPDRPDSGSATEQAVGSAEPGGSWPPWPDSRS
jgi:subtilisin family serine protease